MGIWSNAFRMPRHPDLTEQEKTFLAGVALKVRRREMGQVAALTVESTRPLHNLGSQALVFLMPMLGALFGRERAEKAVKLLENPKAMDFFLKELESVSETDDNGAKNVKKRP